jgi:hypothetical protein
LQKYFSGFGPDIEEISTKSSSSIDVQRNEQVRSPALFLSEQLSVEKFNNDFLTRVVNVC